MTNLLSITSNLFNSSQNCQNTHSNQEDFVSAVDVSGHVHCLVLTEVQLVGSEDATN